MMVGPFFVGRMLTTQPLGMVMRGWVVLRHDGTWQAVR